MIKIQNDDLIQWWWNVLIQWWLKWLKLINQNKWSKSNRDHNVPKHTLKFSNFRTKLFCFIIFLKQTLFVENWHSLLHKLKFDKCQIAYFIWNLMFHFKTINCTTQKSVSTKFKIGCNLIKIKYDRTTAILQRNERNEQTWSIVNGWSRETN